MIHLHTIRVLFRAPTGSLFGIPYEMRRDVNQEPRHLWQAKQRELDELITRPHVYYGPLGKPKTVGPTDGWILVDERDPDMLAWLSALVDVPANVWEWCECKLATDDELNTNRRHDKLASISHQPGDVVRVLFGYRGNGHYAPDGTEGLYIVKARMDGGKGLDYKLIRLPHYEPLALLDTPQGGEYRRYMADVCEWELISHASRLVRHYVNLESK